MNRRERRAREGRTFLGSAQAWYGSARSCASFNVPTVTLCALCGSNKNSAPSAVKKHTLLAASDGLHVLKHTEHQVRVDAE
jgi:hypothetical protein